MRQRVVAMLNYTAGSLGVQNAMKAASIKTIFTSRQFLEKGNLLHIPEQTPDANWVYLEDLKDSITREDKRWIAQHLLTPHKAMLAQNRRMQQLSYLLLDLKALRKVSFIATPVYWRM